MHRLRGDRLGVDAPGGRPGGQPVGEGVGEALGEEGAEDGGADAAADLPEVVVGAGGGAEVGGADAVLHGEHQHRHDQADPRAEHRHPDAVVQPRGAGLQQGEQPHAERGEDPARDGVRAVAPGLADELAGEDRSADDAAHHGEHQQAGLGGAGAVDHLEEGRQVAGGAEQGDADHRPDQAGEVEDRLAEEPQRDEGFGRVPLGDEEEHRRQDGSGGEREDGPRAPGVLRPAPAGQQHQAGGGGGQQQDAGHVEAATGGGLGELEDDGDHGEGDQAEGDVEVEAPAPRHVVGEEAAEQRPGDRGEAEGGADQPHVAGPLPGRHDVGDDRLHADHEAARAEPLEGAEGDEFVHRTGPAREPGAHDEDDDGELEDALAAEEVAELAVDRQRDGRGEQVGGDGPGHLVEAVQLADDLRQRGGHDHLLQRGEEQREHQPDEDHPHLAGAEPRVTGGGGGRTTVAVVATPLGGGKRFAGRQAQGGRVVGGVRPLGLRGAGGRGGPGGFLPRGRPVLQRRPAHVTLPSSRRADCADNWRQVCAPAHKSGQEGRHARGPGQEASAPVGALRATGRRPRKPLEPVR